MNISRPIIEAKEAYLLQNPNISFGSQMKENSTVYPYRFPFVEGQTYLLINATDTETNFFPIVEEAVFLLFDIEEIHDENTGEYEGDEIFYNFSRLKILNGTQSVPDKNVSRVNPILNLQRDKTKTDRDVYFSETVFSETERMGFYMIYKNKHKNTLLLNSKKGWKQKGLSTCQK